MKYDYSCRYSSSGGSKQQDPPLRLSILGLGGIDLINPLQNPALEVLHVGEPHRFEEILRLGAAAAHLAVRHDLTILRQFLIAPRQLTERNQRRARDAVDLILVRLTHVENERRLAGVEL